MTGVSIRDLEVGFGPVKVLDHMKLEVEDGEFMVLLGPSGCGKSTLLNAIAGLLDIRDGEIWIGGNNVTWEEPKDRGIGMVFQSYALYPRMTVAGNLSFGLRMQRVPKPEIEKRIEATARLLQITDLLHRRPTQLSGGQRQRVAIGRALVRQADVFLFDEPLSNLDAKLRAELRVELKRLHQELHSTMVYVTHDQIEALTLADRIAVMSGGEIQQLAPPEEVYNHPANRFVAGFIGSPAMNFLDGQVKGNGSGATFAAAGVDIPLQRYQFANGGAAETGAVLGIRPEHIAFGEADDDHFKVASKVELVEPMGADTLAWCRLGEHPLSIRIDSEHRLKAGDTINFGVDLRRASLFGEADGNRL